MDTGRQNGLIYRLRMYVHLDKNYMEQCDTPSVIKTPKIYRYQSGTKRCIFFING